MPFVTRVLKSPFFAVIIFLAFFALAWALRSGLTQKDTHQIQANLANEAQALADNLEREFSVQAGALGRMAKRMENNAYPTRSLWQADANTYLNDFGIYQAIEWIDQEFIIRWLEPATANQNVLGYNVAFDEHRRQALERSAATGQADISGIIDLRQGPKGIVTYHPVGQGSENNGFIAGVFKMQVLAKQLLTDRILDQFQVEIIQRGEPSYALNASSNINYAFRETAPVDLPSLDWQLALSPTIDWVENQRSHWPRSTFLSVILMGALASLTALFAQMTFKRTHSLLRTRLELERQVDERVAVQVDLERLESTDTLTGLANRRFFMEDLAHTLSIADRQLRQVALVMIDLDRFQVLNDTLGHQFGDELLIKIAERLNSLSSETILVAYSGGDEFMICHQQMNDIDGVIHLLGEIKQCFAEPFKVLGQVHQVTATMGVAVYPQSGHDADTLLRNADIALYRAKDQGRNTYQFYTEGMQEKEMMRLELDKDLSEALANDEFVLHYQPQLNLDTGEINNVEALIRWQHPTRGLLSPMEFIPLAEESGRITEIGRWVVLAACRQLARWKGTPCEHLRIAVNLSGRELEDATLVDHVRDTLAAENVAPHMLELELTEEIFIQNIAQNRSQLSQLHQLGTRLAIDDFGVGYSSLGYLRDFPVDLLKIDRSFITNVTERHDDAVITRAVINLAHNLGIQVVAEGVETEDQLSFLQAHKCNLVQGYLISRPVPGRVLERAIREDSLFTGQKATSEL
ncbi:putative bifunctional diguanylate cyclase/phosphodiesterase [Marinobacter sp.]|uniref:putative bifunctional diguanylate cyclase/phosphodiesterase n=1 Tax=Marinobacter sp. TaxID=50741 RepID=UPI002B2702F9|nr:EAL domain-containing protein [Marinobacter sp.]